jgi:hypothetical protein
MTDSVIWSAHSALHQQAIDTTLRYFIANVARGHADKLRQSNRARAMHLRDSLIYRSESLTWHVMQLARMQAAAMAKLHSTMPFKTLRATSCG